MFKDYGFTLQEKKALSRKEKEIDPTPVLVFIAVIIFLACLIHRYVEPTMGQIQGLITPEAHAAEALFSPTIVNAEEARAEMKEYCADYKGKDKTVRGVCKKYGYKNGI